MPLRLTDSVQVVYFFLGQNRKNEADGKKIMLRLLLDAWKWLVKALVVGKFNVLIRWYFVINHKKLPFRPTVSRYLLFNLKLRGAKMFWQWNHCINQLNDDLLNFKKGKGASCERVGANKKKRLVGEEKKERKTPIICTLYSSRYPHLRGCALKKHSCQCKVVWCAVRRKCTTRTKVETFDLCYLLQQ